MIYPVTPVPKPRQTRSDKWKQRSCVMQYRAFADELRLRVGRCESVRRLVFYMPMPMSWSLNVRLQMNGTAHQHKPDLDNLVKAVFDALFEDDQFIWDLHATKVWSETGAIEIA